MPNSPSPHGESPRRRKRREALEARAADLGCPVDQLYLVERLERLQAELRDLSDAERRGRLAEELQRRRGFLELCTQNHMDTTLEERSRNMKEASLLEDAAADVPGFLAADERQLLARVQGKRGSD